MQPARHDIYKQHSRNWRENHYVYPVISRRSGGLSIGINLNPDKVCNFDCIYCSVERTSLPLMREVKLDLLRDELDQMLGLALSGKLFEDPPFKETPASLRTLKDIAFSGDGEPTSFRQFSEACTLVADLLKQHAVRDAKIVLITNATLLDRRWVGEGLRILDENRGEIWAKLDAGTADYYRRVDRSPVPLQQVLHNILTAGRQRPIVIQSMFMNVDGRPPTDDEITAYLHRLTDLREAGCQVKLVQIYTIARGPSEQYVKPLSDAEVDNITARVRAAGFTATPFYGQ